MCHKHTYAPSHCILATANTRTAAAATMFMLQSVRVHRQETMGGGGGYWMSPKQKTKTIEICQEEIQVRFCGETATPAQHERSVFPP